MVEFGKNEPSENMKIKGIEPVAMVYKIPIGLVNTLAQVRDEIHRAGLEELKHSIKSEGKLNTPATVALFDHERATKYIEFINELFGASHTIDELKPIEDELTPVSSSKGKKYFILITGHRRLRAIKELSEEGVDISFTANIIHPKRYEDLIRTQIVENTHERVNPTREAEAIVSMYRLILKKTGKTPTVKEIAKQTGRGEHVVRAAIRFKSLPIKIQHLAINKTLPYGAVIEIARYAEFRKSIERPLDEASLMSLANYFVVSALTVPKFTKYISSKIEHDKQAGRDLFAENHIDEQFIKQIFAKELHKGLHQFAAYLQRVKIALDKGLFTTENIPDTYSPEPPVNLIEKLLQAFLEFAPNLQAMLKQSKRPKKSKEELYNTYVGIVTMLLHITQEQ